MGNLLPSSLPSLRIESSCFPLQRLLHNLEAPRLPRDPPDHSPVRVLVCDSHALGCVPSSRSRNTEHLCLGSQSLSLVSFPLPACPSIAFALVTLLARAFVFLFVQSSDVADLFADRCVRLESSFIHKVVQDIRVLTPLCTSATFSGSASGVSVLDAYFWMRRSTVSSEPRVSSVKAYGKMCKDIDA